jgi:phenylalanyl-tRNA synthetase beta chain
MQISERWLREWVNPALSSRQLADQLTMAGLEVDAVEPVAGDFAGVVVAEIISAEPHPDADKLRVCSVEAGGDAPLQIVCGAPNARVGLKAPLATVGATLPGDFRIKAAKLRGVASQGMLCAAAELGLSEDSDGLLELPGDAPVGEDLRELPRPRGLQYRHRPDAEPRRLPRACRYRARGRAAERPAPVRAGEPFR